MPYDIVKADDGYKVCKKAKTLKAKKECFSRQPLTKSNARQQQKALYASEHGPTSNRNKVGAKFNVHRGGQTLMMSVSAKRLAPYVSQLTNVGASQIIDRLKNGAFHSFGNDITVSLAGDSVGEGVLNWINKKLSQSSLFRPSTGQSYNQGPRSGMSLAFPADTKTLYQMNQNAYGNKRENVGDWTLLHATPFLQFYNKNSDIIIAVRGTADKRDVVADVNIALQNLSNQSRFKEDLATITEFQRNYPQSQYKYYYTGHSLGGALIDEFLKRGLGISAISFNPAVSKENYESKNHKRIYNTEDPLYQLMGQYVPTAEVREFKSGENINKGSVVNKLLSYVPFLGDAKQMLQGHSLDNYSGGRMPCSMKDRPYMRGAGPLCSGSGWFDTALEKLGSVAVPAMTLGSLKLSDIKKGDYVPKVDRIPEYAMDSGARILQAKAGDPSGILEKLQGEGRMNLGVGGAYCSWVEEQGRYGPKWVEKCEGNGADRLEGEGIAEMIGAISDMSKAAVERVLFPAMNALGTALRKGAEYGREIPQAVRTILETSRGVYRREDTQTVLSYLRAHPDVLIPFLPTPFAVGAVVVRLIQHYLNLPPQQTGREAEVQQAPREREEDDAVILGDGRRFVKKMKGGANNENVEYPEDQVLTPRHSRAGLTEDELDALAAQRAAERRRQRIEEARRRDREEEEQYAREFAERQRQLDEAPHEGPTLQESIDRVRREHRRQSDRFDPRRGAGRYVDDSRIGRMGQQIYCANC